MKKNYVKNFLYCNLISDGITLKWVVKASWTRRLLFIFYHLFCMIFQSFQLKNHPKNLSQPLLNPYLHGIGSNSTSKTQVYVPNCNFNIIVQAQLTFDRNWRSLGIWNRYTDVVQNSRFFDETIKNLKINNAETRYKIQALLSLEVFLIHTSFKELKKNLNWISWIFVYK